MNRSISLQTVILFLTCCLTAVSSRAAVISQTSTPLDESILASGTFADPLAGSETIEVLFDDYEFTFDQFDPSLGTLTDIRISYYFSYTASATSNSQVDGDKILSLSLGYGVLFETSGGSFDGNGNGNGAGTGTADDDLLISASISNENSSVFWDPIITDAQGTGTFNISVLFDDTSWNAQIVGYFTDYEIKRDEGAYFQVDYEYTPIPEPTVLAIMSLSGAGMLVRRIRNDDVENGL